ncbi:threonylcarbamoyladenosine tRNA methylthiotransferase MtaB [Thermoanaerobacter thermohydrosulfuricus]|uniref:Threonylcarbamoyladenosine tRNA methylthiotransferase MtaB n=2 Tax=Thermoanaerobacter thermohydrosulfuricus TaxID=1516 RepID=M8CLT8_THETY|nr:MULTISPECIES: tRNA (N(6)-L-threonylcarbamoyladenosine(37)-C(2))-methylthiotransferase MtaB [Thermoanaerobacter]EMT38185.1 MiaB-like tRNA modifying enzyme [Thermoanaerobacter thermohydrosulfuricus WC1]SDF28287.1 threonylcarbamoyladenosine tRNA methylthiotransferase MtaB [Thermoanaerobacter thermohydrosulfuricus]SFE36305.1 threonylcarbamoyladenosine tRNA methylthiotransferase MtaB [Thermoanaerobacter thermohydrosulfuricus]
MAKVDLTLSNEEFYERYGHKKTVAFYTLGCKVNQYETEVMAELFKKAGYEVVDFNEKADVYVINTCTVTNRSDMKSRQEIRKARKKNPDALVVAVGCYVQVSPEEAFSLPEVDIAIGTKNKDKIVELVEEFTQKNQKLSVVNNIMTQKEYEEFGVTAYTERTRAYIKIQDGCNQYCTYCIIPYARGPVRSRDPKKVLDEVKRFADSGYKEIVLTGIHIASYGKDLKNIGLLDIIKMIHEIDGIKRIRLSSIEPTFLTEEFVKEIANLPKMCRHYHVSLQSGCDETLKRMGRRYTTKEYKSVIDRLREYIKDVAITTDVMVGFPGETEEEFLKTYKFVEEICFSKMHVFKYSRRKGTRAYNFPNQVANHIKEDRSKKLIELSNRCEYKFMESFIGKTLEVLFEQPVKNMEGYVEGLTDNYLSVAVKGDRKLLRNEIFPVKIKEIKDNLLIGEIEGI